MEKGIAFKGKIQNSLKVFVIFTSIFGFIYSNGFFKPLFELKYFEPLFSAYIFSIWIILFFAGKIEKKIDYFPLIGIGIPFIFILGILPNIISNEDYVMLFIPFQILTFGGLILLFSGNLFEYIWGLKDGFLMKKWINLPKENMDSLYNTAKINIFFIAFVHLLLTFHSLFLKNIIFAFEQFSVFFLFSVLCGWFYTDKNSIRVEPKKIAASLFFISLIIITFDTILTQIQYLRNDYNWYLSAYIVLLISIINTNYFINPEKSKISGGNGNFNDIIKLVLEGMHNIIKPFNIKIFGNLYNISVKLSYKLLFQSLLPILLAAFLGLILIGQSPTNEINFQKISILMLVFCIISVIKEYKIVSYFIRKYINLKLNILIIIGFQSILMFYLFFSLKQFLIFAILGAFFWFSSGVLRGILEFSKAIFNENPLKLVKLAQIYSYLRSSYYFLGLLLFINVLNFKQLEIELLPLLINKSILGLFIILLYLMIFLFIPTLILFFCIYNLYPYLNQNFEVLTSIEIIQFISSNKKGYKFKDISLKFNNINEDVLKDYLDRLIYVNYIIQKNNNYKLMPHYILIQQSD